MAKIDKIEKMEKISKIEKIREEKREDKRANKTYSLTLKDIEAVRRISFIENKKKQDVVSEAIEEYCKSQFPEIYKEIF
jgi:DNA-binding PadR family transcriptional regulator